eukprot:1147699-Pelagomonas_calceolata.AAC.2
MVTARTASALCVCMNPQGPKRTSDTANSTNFVVDVNQLASPADPLSRTARLTAHLHVMWSRVAAWADKAMAYGNRFSEAQSSRYVAGLRAARAERASQILRFWQNGTVIVLVVRNTNDTRLWKTFHFFVQCSYSCMGLATSIDP